MRWSFFLAAAVMAMALVGDVDARGRRGGCGGGGCGGGGCGGGMAMMGGGGCGGGGCGVSACCGGCAGACGGAYYGTGCSGCGSFAAYQPVPQQQYAQQQAAAPAGAWFQSGQYVVWVPNGYSPPPNFAPYGSTGGTATANTSPVR